MTVSDHASTTFQLKIKEAIHIQWEKPTLNHQLYPVNNIHEKITRFRLAESSAVQV